MEWKIQTAEEAARADRGWWDSLPQEELDRIAWHEKHPRCEECGQFLKKKPPREPGSLELTLEPQADRRDQWYSHYIRDYWGEYDHR